MFEFFKAGEGDEAEVTQTSDQLLKQLDDLEFVRIQAMAAEGASAAIRV